MFLTQQGNRNAAAMSPSLRGASAQQLHPGKLILHTPPAALKAAFAGESQVHFGLKALYSLKKPPPNPKSLSLHPPSHPAAPAPSKVPPEQGVKEVNTEAGQVTNT